LVRCVLLVTPPPAALLPLLVVGHFFKPVLLVLSLPSLALVHTHRMEGLDRPEFHVVGLAAGHCGTVLAVCDSMYTHVLAWPLPGMPELD